MSNLPERRRERSPLALADDALLVAAAVVVAVVVLKAVGAIVATVWFFVKIAALAALIFAIMRALRSRAR